MKPAIEGGYGGMPTQYQKAFGIIEHETCAIRDKYTNYRYLFDHSEEHENLLRESGYRLFIMIQRMMLDDFVMSLTRLGDPAKSMSRENLSFRGLVNRLDTNCSAGLIVALTARADKFDELTENLRDRRSKDLAHNDRERALGETEAPGLVTLKLIGECLEEAEKFVQQFYGHFCNVETFSSLSVPEGAAEVLIDQLVRARAYKDLRAKNAVEPLHRFAFYKPIPFEGRVAI